MMHGQKNIELNRRKSWRPCHTSPCWNMAGNVRVTQHWGAFAQPLFQWKINNYYVFSVCVCSLRCPESNAHAPYCHMWPVRFYSIFPHHLINGTTLEKWKPLNTKCMVWFSLQLLTIH